MSANIPLLEFRMNDTIIHASRNSQDVHIQFVGKIEIMLVDRIDLFMKEITNIILNQSITLVQFDIARLLLINSRCLRLFLQFINTLLEAKKESDFRIHFIFNKNLGWQEMNLSIFQDVFRSSFSTEGVDIPVDQMIAQNAKGNY